jgi:glycosyltransferase involved in cell wall biosynthesis
MKILHIIDSGGLYGAEVVLLNLVAEQIELGLDPIIASIGEKHIPEKPLETEAIKRGFNVKKFRMRAGPNCLGALKILRFAHQESFDLMHSHGYKGNILFGFLPKKIRKIPLIATLHGWTSTNSFTRIKLYEWLDGKSLRFIDAVVLVSEAMKSHPKFKGRKGINFHVIPNGIPIPDTQYDNSTNQLFNDSSNLRFDHLTNKHFDESTNQRLDENIIDFCKKAYTIGSIGRLSPEKGYGNLIEAVKIVSDDGIDISLVIIGEGEERETLENKVRELGLQGRVILPGYLREAKRYLSCFKVFALSSLTEGLPITILEAMREGVPILSTIVGGVPEALDHGKAGVLVGTSNARDLTQGILRLHDNPELGKHMAEIAKKIVFQIYSSQRMTIEYLKIYKHITKIQNDLPY